MIKTKRRKNRCKDTWIKQLSEIVDTLTIKHGKAMRERNNIIILTPESSYEISFTQQRRKINEQETNYNNKR